MAKVKYFISFKTFESKDDKRLGNDNFTKGSEIVTVACTRNTSAGTAKNKFFSGLPTSEKHKTVITGACIY